MFGGMAVGLGTALSACGTDEEAGSGAAGPIAVATYGGSLDAVLREAYFDKFTTDSGVEVLLSANASLATAKLQASTGKPQLDIVDLTASEFEKAVSDGLLEKYEYKNKGQLNPSTTDKYGFQYDIYGWGMTWKNEGRLAAAPPKDWTEFWDTDKYPGKRSLYEKLDDGSLLEVALIADGVSMDDLYPLDVDRALNSLDKLGKTNIIWYSTNQEPIQHITSGAATLAQAFNGRVLLANEDGEDLTFSYSQAAISGNYFAILKGAPHKAAAMDFVNSVAENSKGCVTVAEAAGYGCANTQAYEMMSKSLIKNLPGSPALEDQTFMKDGSWWSKNADEAQRQFKAWQRS